MEKKMTLNLDDLRVETFTPRQWVRSGVRGTVFAQNHTEQDCTVVTDCGNTCPGWGETCDYATCAQLCDTNVGCPTLLTACTWAEPCTAFETCDGSCEETCGPTGQPPECTAEEGCTECEVGVCTDGECCPWH